MQKKIIVFLLLLPVFILHSSYSTRAASPSPSPIQSPIAESEITDNLKKRLQESLGGSPSTPPLSTARAYVGVVKDVIKDTVIMSDKDGKKDIKIQSDSVILRSPGNTIIKPENIRIGDYIIAIGYPQSADTLLGRRIIVSVDPIKTPLKTSGLGIIIKISKNSLTLKLSDKDQLISLTAKTIFKSSAGLIELADLELGDTLIYTALIGSDESLTATLIMRTQTSSIAL